MHNRKLKKLLNLWQKNELITEYQSKNILEFMKERQKEVFFRLLKWLMIIGTFWLVFGFIATIINLYEIDFFQRFFKSITFFILDYVITPLNISIISPIGRFVEKIFGDNQYYFYSGTFCLILSAIILIFKSKNNKSDKKIDNLNLSDEQKNVLKTNWVVETIFCICLSAVFCFYNMLLIPPDSFYSASKIFPVWNVLGAITFICLAYIFKKNIYLVFGIYFVSLSAGMFSGYNCACYWIGASRPVIQILVAVILLLTGYITRLKLDIKDNEDEDTYIQEKFVSTYNWTGLLLLFIALWITSLWGFEFDYRYDSGELEIWVANILFILASVGAMFFGVKTEQKIFFNYGLVFLIIETYTVLCGRLWDKLPIGVSSLLLGVLMIATAKILQKRYK